MKSNYLVDTNIISELCKKSPNQGVVDWAANSKSICLSAIVVEEIFYGLSFKPKQQIFAWFVDFVRDCCEIISVNQKIAQRSGEFRGLFKKDGLNATQADMLIAATAYEHNLTLVTRNEKDFKNCKISILNPFS